ncbi:MAG: hypothetical protein IMX02_12890 [Limnochordaceae bacterium]|nr:hypothetical protein [Limnochordaceae bacterium]
MAQGLGLRLPALRVASVLGGVMVGTVAAAGLAIIARSGTHEAAMPLASASAALHPVALGLHLGVLFAAIYTTGVAAAVSLGSSGRGRASGPMGAVTRQAGWWILSAVPVALAGFAETVARLYPAAGWMALTVLALRAGFASWLRRRLY